jgi:hypothetical protein
MNIVAEYIDKLKFPVPAAWLVTLFLLLFAGRFLKDIIAYVLMTLYKFFIGSEYHTAPY